MANKKYIGDSVYAELKDGQVILTTENGLPFDPSNTIVLEPEVVIAFMKFLDDIAKELKAKKYN